MNCKSQEAPTEVTDRYQTYVLINVHHLSFDTSNQGRIFRKGMTQKRRTIPYIKPYRLLYYYCTPGSRFTLTTTNESAQLRASTPPMHHVICDARARGSQLAAARPRIFVQRRISFCGTKKNRTRRSEPFGVWKPANTVP